MLDEKDRRILALLQSDATFSVAEIADRVSLSTTPCWRRIHNLEAAGYVRGRVALLDEAKLNLAVTVFVAVRTHEHSQAWLEAFAVAVRDFPEIVEIHRLAGDIDYLLKIVAPDIAAYDAIYKRLIERVALSDVSSYFAMEKIKATTALPLDYVSR